MYSRIVLCLSEKEDEVLAKQIEMLRERHRAQVERISADAGADFISECEAEVLFISDDEELLAKAGAKGLATNDPQKMKEAGIIYACDQIIDLICNGASHIHVYSMNKPDIAAGIMRNLETIIN